MNDKRFNGAVTVERALLAVAVLAAGTLAFNGFHRFDGLQLAAAALATGGASVAAAITWWRGREAGVGVGVGLSLWLAAVYVAVGALLAGHGDALDQIALFAVAGGVALCGACDAEGTLRRWIGGALAVATSFGAFCAVLQAVGVSFPPDIPFASPLGVGVRGPFDAPEIASVWFASACFFGLALLAADERRIGGTVAIASAVGLGFVANGLLLAVGVAGVLVAAAVSLLNDRRGGALAITVAVLAAAIGVLGPTPAEPTTPERLAVTSRTPGVESGMEWPYAEEGTMALHRDAVWRYATSSLPFGAGPAAWPGREAEFFENDTPFALQQTDGIAVSRRAPAPIAELLGDYGPWVPLCLLAALGLAVSVAARRRRWFVVAGLSVWSVAAVTSPGLLSAAGMAALGFLAVAATSGVGGKSSLSLRPASFVVVPIALLAMVTQVQAVQWGYANAAAVVYLGEAKADEAAPFVARARETQLRFSSEMNGALVAYFGEARDRDATLAALRSAEALRPSSVAARARIADLYVRSSLADESIHEQLQRARRMYEWLVALEPNTTEYVIAHANACLATMDIDAAVAVLATAAQRPVPDAALVEIYTRMGEIEEDRSQPAAAFEAYSTALELAGPGPERRQLENRVHTTEQWVETGSRPRSRDDGHGHGGGGHEGHGH